MVNLSVKVLMTAGALLLHGCAKQPEKKESIRPVKAIQLEQIRDSDVRTFPGRTRAIKRANLSFRVDGPMIARPGSVGDQVKGGQLLAKIDPRDYEVKLQNAIGRLERTKADLRFAKRDAVRAENIWKEDPGAISQSLLDRKKEDVNRLKGEVLSLTAEVAAAKDQLEYTNLLSPIDGTIVATYAQAHEYVQAKQPIMRLLNTAQIEIGIDVSESMISQIPFTKEVIVTLDALPGRTFPAIITEIGTEASVTTRTYPVTLVVDQPSDTKILSGMAGHARLTAQRSGKSREQVFLVPTSAVFTILPQQQSSVWVIDPQTQQVHQQPVSVEAITSEGILINQGLKKGDWIVTAGVHSLQEGQKVELFKVSQT